MEYFAGFDVSLEETAVCVVDATGGILVEAKVHGMEETRQNTAPVYQAGRA